MEDIRPQKYGRIAIALHWFMLILVGLAYVSMSLGDLRSASPAGHEAWRSLHFEIGFLVFVVALARIAARRMGPGSPPINSNPPLLQLRLARLNHIALYAFVLAMPVLGLLALNAGGRRIQFSGTDVPALIGPNPELASQFAGIHSYLAVAGYLFIGIHCISALIHHFYFRDDTVVRMLPEGRER